MYARFRLNLRERFPYRASSNIKLENDGPNNAASGDLEIPRKTEIVSTRFPNYRVVYTFPYVKYASTLNGVKLRFTCITGAALPVIAGLHLADLLSYDVAGASICSGVILTTWLHTFGILCNNLVGFIYLNLDENKTILSYINYWGKRVDMETTIDEVIPLSDNPISITDPLYKKIMFFSQKKKLKINLNLGHINDIKGFGYILGTV